MRIATLPLLALGVLLALPAPAHAQPTRCGLVGSDTLLSFLSADPRPIQRVVFEDLTGGTAATVPAGTVIRFYTDALGGPLTVTLPGGPSPAYAFVEVQRPGGAAACGGGGNQQGCAETGGVWVYAPEQTYAYELPTAVNGGANSTDQFHLTSIGGPGPEAQLATYTDAFEIRFDQPSWAAHIFAGFAGEGWAFEVPFSVWDIGAVQPFETNNPADDERLVPALYSDAAQASGNAEDMCANNATTLPYRHHDDLSAGMVTDRVYAYYPSSSYADFAAFVEGALVAAEPGPLPAGFALLGARPNPVRGAGAVAYAMGEPGPVRIEVLDALGRRVATLVDGARPAGTHRAALDAAGLPGGVYLVRMTAAGGVATARVAVVR